MGMMVNRRRYTGKKGLLPSGYTQVEYVDVPIGSIGYISTDYIPSSLYQKYVYTAKYYDVATGRRQLNGWVSNPWFGCYYGRFSASTETFYTFVPRRGSMLSSNVWYDFEIKMKCRKIPKNKFYLFAPNGDTGNTAASNMAVKNLQIYEGETPILKGFYIPCISPNNEIGLYNIITDTFCKLIIVR